MDEKGIDKITSLSNLIPQNNRCIVVFLGKNIVKADKSHIDK